MRDDGRVRHTNSRIAECGHLLRTLAGVLPQLITLEHVGLHNLPLQRQLMPALGQVLIDLPPSVTALTLSTPLSRRNEAGWLQRSMLFNAIGMIRSLRELHMREWEVFVGDDGACVEPLFHLPHLQAVYVRSVKQSSAFPSKLPFKGGL
jgi:hypothetical protein